jgi:oligopeptidase B
MLHQQNLMEVPLQLTPGTNLHYDATSFSWTVSSPVQPPVTHQYHFRNQTWTQQDQHHNDECTVRYSTWTATSRDGTLVPMTMIHDIHTDPAHHERPVLLLGYGAYGEPCLKPEYDPTLVPLVKRHGMVLAYAHTRGGGELGRAWYHAGRKYHKQNAIDDYLACAEMLLEKVEPRQLSARAFSAGGAVVAAAVNQRPTLFGSAVYVNAFLDVMTSMADPTLALTEHEYDEWGDPLRDKVAAETIMSYCPMTNIQPNTQYPPTLLICALDDVNVPYWHSLAFHAKILETTQSTDQFVYVAEQGGHHLHGTSLDMFSIVNTFLLKYNAPKSLEVK